MKNEMQNDSDDVTSIDPLRIFEKEIKSIKKILLISFFALYGLLIIKIFTDPSIFSVVIFIILMIALPFLIYILKNVIQLGKMELENLKEQKYWISKYSSLFSKIGIIFFILGTIIFIYIIMATLISNYDASSCGQYILENLDLVFLSFQFFCGFGFSTSLSNIRSAIEDLKKTFNF